MVSKLITLPDDDPVAAQNIFLEWLNMEDKVLLVVLGDTNIAFKTAERADGLTGGVEEEPRWVIHAPVREDIIDILITLEDPNELIIDWDEPLFIAVSITDVIRDMVVRDGTLPNLTRIDDAFIAAELD